jgi:hypothetical protein
LWGAAETSRGVFLWGRRGAYWLDENNRVEKIAGISDDPVILGFYEMSLNHALGRVFVRTTNGLFVYSQAGVLAPVPGLVPSIVPNVVHSVHEIRSELYALASNGVFHLSEKGRMERIREKDKDKDIEGVRNAGYETREGVFFISSYDDATYRLTDSGEVLKVALPQNYGDADDGKAQKPRDIKNTMVSLLLATDRSLYRFSEVNRWVRVPSGDLGGDVNIVPVPKIEGVTADVPVFVETWNGVFKWTKRPFDISSITILLNYIANFSIKALWNYIKDSWNYIGIFWPNEVGFILLGLLVILFAFVHYSLCSYGWVCYYILELVAPSRVYNQIFINYRSDDTGGYALALYNELCQRFDRKLIFFDRAEGEIDYGDKLPDKIRDAVEQCTVLLALIGSRWLDAQKDNGSRRLDDPDDYVRQEIALALERDKKVIPVLLGNVSMPKADSLPEPLKPFSQLLGMNLRVTEKTPSIEAGVDELSQRLVIFPNIPPAKRSWLVFQMWR